MKTVLSNTMTTLPSGLGQEVSGTVGGLPVKSRGLLFEGSWLRYYLIGKDMDCAPGIRYTNAGYSAGDTLTGCRFELK